MSKMRKMTLCGLFAATTAVLSQIAIPLQPVPISLSLLSVYIAAAMLGPLYGAISQSVYVFVGMVGLPVFSGFRGGLPALLAPTGGYIIGYIIAAFVGGLIARSAKGRILPTVIAFIAACITCHAFGTAYFMYITHTDFIGAMSLCVLPFLPGDILKIALAAVVSIKLRRYGMYGSQGSVKKSAPLITDPDTLRE